MEQTSARGEFVLEARFVPVSGPAGFTALRIRDGRIAELGADGLVEAARRSAIPVRELRQKTVLPGIVDPHTHFEHLAIGEIGRIDCRFSRCRTIGEIVERLRDHQAECGHDEWIRGYTNLFIDQMLADRRLPTREDLDRVSRDRPVVLNCGGHVSVLNSAALARLPEGVFAPGAEGFWGAPVIGRDAAGLPNGVVAEIDGHIPQLSLSDAERTDALLRAEERVLLSQGVTTIGEMVESRASMADWAGWFRAGYRGRVSLFALWPAVGELEAVLDALQAFEVGAHAERLRAIGLKAFADGGYSSRNAAILAEYLPEARGRLHDRGRINLSHGRVRELVAATRERGLRLAIHANGARAQLHVLDAILSEGDPYRHDPVRIEHLGNLVEDARVIDLAKRANVMPMVQPGFLWSFVGDFLSSVMGDAGRRGRLPLRTFRDDSIVTPFSSDMALGSMDRELDPFRTMMDAVDRIGFWGHEVEEHERLAFPEALELHTIEAARALGLHEQVGSIELGKAADLLILDTEAFASRDPELMRPEAVYVGGDLVFERSAVRAPATTVQP